MRFVNAAFAIVLLSLSACVGFTDDQVANNGIGSSGVYDPVESWEESSEVPGGHGYRVGFYDHEFVAVRLTSEIEQIVTTSYSAVEPSRVYEQQLLEMLLAGTLPIAPCDAVLVQFTETNGMYRGFYPVRDSSGATRTPVEMVWDEGNHPTALVPLYDGAAALVTPTGPITSSVGNPQLGFIFIEDGEPVQMQLTAGGSSHVWSTPRNTEMGIDNALLGGAAQNARLSFGLVHPNACS